MTNAELILQLVDKLLKQKEEIETLKSMKANTKDEKTKWMIHNSIIKQDRMLWSILFYIKKVCVVVIHIQAQMTFAELWMFCLM